MTISSSATTAAVTARSVKLAPVNEFAISAPNAGPPVTSARSVPGKPSDAATRSDLTASLSANPDRSPRSGTVATAARPSSDTTTGGAPPSTVAAASMRCRAASAAATSSGVSAAPSVRVTTTIAGTTSPPGNCVLVASARADSEAAGTATGDCSPESPLPIRPNAAPEASTTSTASIHDRR